MRTGLSIILICTIVINIATSIYLSPEDEEDETQEKSSSIDSTDSSDSQYEKKITSFFIPPETGEYKFFSSCSKRCSVYLSETKEPSKKHLIISQKKAVKGNFFEKYPDQASHLIFLEKDKHYFLQASSLESKLADVHLSVGVVLPDDHKLFPISKPYLSDVNVEKIEVKNDEDVGSDRDLIQSNDESLSSQLKEEKAFKRTRKYSKKRVLQKLQKIEEFVKSLENVKGEGKFVDDSSIDEVINTLKQYVPKTSFQLSSGAMDIENSLHEGSKNLQKKSRKKEVLQFKKKKKKSKLKKELETIITSGDTSSLSEKPKNDPDVNNEDSNGWVDLINKLEDHITKESSKRDGSDKRRKYYTTQLEKIKGELNNLKTDYANKDEKKETSEIEKTDAVDQNNEKLDDKPTDSIRHITPQALSNIGIGDNNDLTNKNLTNINSYDKIDSPNKDNKDNESPIIDKNQNNGLGKTYNENGYLHSTGKPNTMEGNKDESNVISISIAPLEASDNAKTDYKSQSKNMLPTISPVDSLNTADKNQKIQDISTYSPTKPASFESNKELFSKSFFYNNINEKYMPTQAMSKQTLKSEYMDKSKVTNSKTIDDILSNIVTNEKGNTQNQNKNQINNEIKQNDYQENSLFDKVGTLVKNTKQSHILSLNPSLLDQNSLMELNSTNIQGDFIKTNPNDDVVDVKMASPDENKESFSNYKMYQTTNETPNLLTEKFLSSVQKENLENHVDTLGSVKTETLEKPLQSVQDATRNHDNDNAIKVEQLVQSFQDKIKEIMPSTKKETGLLRNVKIENPTPSFQEFEKPFFEKKEESNLIQAIPNSRDTLHKLSFSNSNDAVNQLVENKLKEVGINPLRNIFDNGCSDSLKNNVEAQTEALNKNNAIQFYKNNDKVPKNKDNNNAFNIFYNEFLNTFGNKLTNGDKISSRIEDSASSSAKSISPTPSTQQFLPKPLAKENVENSPTNIQNKPFSFVKVDKDNLQKVLNDAFTGKFHLDKSDDNYYRNDKSDGESLKAELQESIEKALVKTPLESNEEKVHDVMNFESKLPTLHSRGMPTTPSVLQKPEIDHIQDSLSSALAEDLNSTNKASFTTQKVSPILGLQIPVPSSSMDFNTPGANTEIKAHGDLNEITEVKSKSPSQEFYQNFEELKPTSRSALQMSKELSQIESNSVSKPISQLDHQKEMSFDSAKENNTKSEDAFLVNKMKFESTVTLPDSPFAKQTDEDKIKELLKQIDIIKEEILSMKRTHVEGAIANKKSLIQELNEKENELQQLRSKKNIVDRAEKKEKIPINVTPSKKSVILTKRKTKKRSKRKFKTRNNKKRR